MAKLELSDFEMASASSSSNVGRESAHAHDLMVEVMNDVYKHSQYKRDTLEEAKMWVYACERFDEWWITTEKNFWSSITSAVQDTLQKYPLSGYEPGQGGFGKKVRL